MKTCITLALVLLLGWTTTAYAQEAKAHKDGLVWKLATAQLVRSLESPIDDVRSQSLKNAIVYATLYRDKVDLSRAVPSIRRVYEQDAAAGQHTLALAALQAIGNSRAAAYMARHVSAAASDDARLVLVSVLHDYYEARNGDARIRAASISSSP